MSELRVGVIGVRRGGRLLSVIQGRPDAAVVAACDLDEERLRRLVEDENIGRAFLRYDEMLASGLDVVVVATPPHLHADHTVQALEAGCHVLCEVPAVVSFEEAKRVVEAVERTGRTYMLAENACFLPFALGWQRMAAAGYLGEMVYAEAEYVHDLYRPGSGGAGSSWRRSFPPIQYITHSLGPILSLSGERCRLATGFGTGTRTRPDHGADDVQVGVYHTDSGALIKVMVGFSVVRRPPFHYYSVYTTKGCVETSREGDGTLAYFGDVPHQKGPARYAFDDGGDPLWAERRMVGRFLDAVRGTGPNPIDVYRSMDLTLPGIAAVHSIERGGERVEIPDLRSTSA